MQYTIKDIARLAGVSRGTVDRIIHKRGPVSPATYEKVMGVLNEINYVPNIVGRALKKNKNYRIAVFIPDHTIVKYWEEVVTGIKKGAEEFQYFGISVEETYYSSSNTKVFEEQAKAILDSSPEAVLIAPILLEESISFIKECLKREIRVVYINTQLPSIDTAYYVGTQRKVSGRVAANLFDCFIDDGNILILNLKGEIENPIHMERKEIGFREYFEEKSRSIKSIESISIEKESTNLDQIVNNFVLSDDSKKGIFVSGSHVHRVAKIVRENNLNVFLVGFDLIPQNIEFLEQGTIQFLIHEKRKNQGYLGIKYLAEFFLYGKEVKPHSYLPVDVVNRENYKLYLSMP
ncbi:LacI family DNA-binding transcriptional regulator [Muricauda sp. ANG21]|uniref:LacI family DNA-binding transcriptional regulator n=1 Tax=Allomuricauda sp. ANG21 TaxID=3042468 RepID=UPI003456A6DA